MKRNIHDEVYWSEKQQSDYENPNKSKIEVSVEEVIRISDERWAINKLEFSNIVWTYQGKPIDIPKKLLDDFELCGLNNMDFITSNFLPSRPWQSEAKW